MKKVLLIEDNREIASMIFEFFENSDLDIDYADNGELGLKLARENNFDIILLDLMLPRIDGLTVCNFLREEGNNTSILMLTALDGREDMLSGFEHGADDYLTKPFDLDILYARMQAIFRRSSSKGIKNGYLIFGEITLDLNTHSAYRGDRALSLNPTTFMILELLVKKAPTIVTREELAELLWGDNEVYTDSLRSHIYQLRNQLDKSFDFQMLKTVPKVGFRLEEKNG